MESLGALWVLLALASACAATGLVNSTDDSETICVISRNTVDSNWPEVMFFPDADANPRPGKVLGEGCYVAATEDDVKFKLYTRQGPKEGEDLFIDDVDRLKRSTLNATQPTFFITHGYISSSKSATVQDIKNSYLGSNDCNVVTVDWSAVADTIFYFVAKKQTVSVGGFVSRFVVFLVREGGVTLSSVHLVGHSLGAHVMGIAGKGVARSLHSKVDRITGLDPAGPLFTLQDVEKRLNRGDAEFVDVIHTCSGWLGFEGAIGHVDFFPNGGSESQPGCPREYVLGSICSHSRSWEFFVESISSPQFKALPCESYEDYLAEKCNDHVKVPMGESTPRSVNGSYFLKTASSSPFALG